MNVTINKIQGKPLVFKDLQSGEIFKLTGDHHNVFYKKILPIHLPVYGYINVLRINSLADFSCVADDRPVEIVVGIIFDVSDSRL